MRDGGKEAVDRRPALTCEDVVGRLKSAVSKRVGFVWTEKESTPWTNRYAPEMARKKLTGHVPTSDKRSFPQWPLPSVASLISLRTFPCHGIFLIMVGASVTSDLAWLAPCILMTPRGGRHV